MDVQISSFQIFKVFEFSVVISEKELTKIYSSALSLALEELRLLTSIRLPINTIQNIIEKHNLDCDEVMSFLDGAISIKKVDEEKYFEKVIVVHEWGKEFEDALASEVSCKFDVAASKEDIIEEITSSNSFVLILPKNYVCREFRDMYFEMAAESPGSAICVAMRMNDSFYMSPPFISEMGNPCHFCTSDKIIYAERAQPTKNNWSSLLRFCTETQLDPPEQQLSRLQLALVTGMLSEKIKLWTVPGYGHRGQDRIALASYVNLFSGLITDYGIGKDSHIFPSKDTCGCSFHWDAGKSMFGAIRECLERQFLTRFWLTGQHVECFSAPRIIEISKGGDNELLVEALNKSGEIIAFDISDPSFPGVCIIVFYGQSDADRHVNYCTGMAYSNNIKLAMDKAFEELWQTYRFIDLFVGCNGDVQELKDPYLRYFFLAIHMLVF